MTPRLSAAERQDQILRAATRVFARSNYRAAGVAEIAREAGVSEPLLYKHFPGKKALFLRILERVGRRILEVWEATVADAPDALAALRRAGEVYVENLRRHADEARLQFQALAEAGDPEVAEVLRANHAAYVGFFEALLARGQREGVIRSDVDAHATAWLLDGTGFTLTLTRVLDLDGDDGARTDQMFRGLLDWLADVDDEKGTP
ncbi:MAG: TetR/AcrR family transcriptional regulator [Acidimicrobiia bacterium]|nr:TetR/AcrR family transcriptional regulator [Acidimicrobiia bacterium]